MTMNPNLLICEWTEIVPYRVPRSASHQATLVIRSVGFLRNRFASKAILNVFEVVSMMARRHLTPPIRGRDFFFSRFARFSL